MKLVPAAPEDAPVMADILGDWVRATDWMPALHTADEDRAFCLRMVPRTIVARVEGRTCGFLTRLEEEVQCFYLATDARGQGIGTDPLCRRHSEHVRAWRSGPLPQMPARAGFMPATALSKPAAPRATMTRACPISAWSGAADE